MTRRTSLALFAGAMLVGCRSKTPPKQYDLHGEIKALDPSTKTATIKHERIGDWMDAMTMEFPVKPDSDFQKLHVGDRVQAKVIVSEDSYYVTAVTVQ